VEVVGIVDAGIKAAAWSPDEELLVLITGELPCFLVAHLQEADLYASLLIR
jgi:hypothetical protein